MNDEKDCIMVYDSTHKTFVARSLDTLDTYGAGNFSFRYNEDDILDEVEEYIKNTYGEHYVGTFKDDPSNNIQVLDVWEHADRTRSRCNIM